MKIPQQKVDGLGSTVIDWSRIRVGDVKPDVSETLQFKLSKVGVRVCAEPFYASLWIALRPRWSHEGPTAWVSPAGVFFNPDFFEQLSLKEAVGVALHEILHEVLMHIIRIERLFGASITPEQAKAANYAADAVVNDLLLRKYLKKNPAMDFELPSGAVLIEEKETDAKTFEELIRFVQQNKDDSGKCPGYGEFQQDMKTSAGDKSGGQGDAAGQAGEGGDEVSPGDKGAGAAGKSTDATEALKRAMIAGALEHARKQGRLPAGLDRFLDDVLEPKKNYFDHLREKLVPIFGAGRDDYSWKRPHRGYRQVGVYAPAIAQKLGIRVMVAWIDTSGSQTQQMVHDCVAEVCRVAEDTGVNELHVCYCDTRIHRIDVVRIGEDTYTPASAPGGGGTDVRPVFEYAAEVEAEAIVCLTDMIVDFPEDPGVPGLWVTTCKTHRAPDYWEVVELYD